MLLAAVPAAVAETDEASVAEPLVLELLDEVPVVELLDELPGVLVVDVELLEDVPVAPVTAPFDETSDRNA